ncbi:hypothetical protein AVEN_70737-1 [Araneus ventricosus]|uniref:Uncharacterized protein n=1 Tax=Araneus ventricosus TaxID=182803 RepID=A0A4Y2KIX3_ARAVE|nr:hypothetical protein AVEN_70737-1 [Araneus ventricosus]
MDGTVQPCRSEVPNLWYAYPWGIPVLLNDGIKILWKEKPDIIEDIELIQNEWSYLTKKQFNSTWRKLCPSCIQGDGYDVFELTDEIVITSRYLAAEVNEKDIRVPHGT